MKDYGCTITGGPDDPVVFTNKARCRDCYRCVRVCPVKAIRIENGQAAVDTERCIACGTCVRECPQGAKAVRSDLHLARKLMAGKRLVAASMAPSFAAFFSDWERKRIPSVLRRLGFAHVGETAAGAWHVAKATAMHVRNNPGQALFCSSCPAFVSYVQRYHPDQVKSLVPVVSPMLAHARLIRTLLKEDVAVIFFGPCVAKKAEADTSAGMFRVDCALTFAELREWLKTENFDLADCEESMFDETPGGEARLFPLEGGSLRTAGIVCDMAEAASVTISGAAEIAALMKDPLPLLARIVEPLFCLNGCIQGPAGGETPGAITARAEVLEYAKIKGPAPELQAGVDLSARFERIPPKTIEYTENNIKDVLAKIGKFTKEDELNCGACGYNSCREKAAAVLQGLAEPQMCVPFMRIQAERRSDRIMETSPNGIILLDTHLNIMAINPSMKRIFTCSDALIGQHISRLLDPHPFEVALAKPDSIIDGTVRDERYKLVYRNLVYMLPGGEQIAGIFVNLTDGARSREALARLQSETVFQAQELLEHQIGMAQTLTRLLGESTAQGEILVKKLVELADTPEKQARCEKGFNPWPTGT